VQHRTPPAATVASTICGKDWAIPQSIEATVNPAIDIRTMRLRPNRPESQPDIGVMMAAATM
jgi:hypothetical protein